jgi:hypothetical protein
MDSSLGHLFLCWWDDNLPQFSSGIGSPRLFSLILYIKARDLADLRGWPCHVENQRHPIIVPAHLGLCLPPSETVIRCLMHDALSAVWSMLWSLLGHSYLNKKLLSSSSRCCRCVSPHHGVLRLVSDEARMAPASSVAASGGTESGRWGGDHQW